MSATHFYCGSEEERVQAFVRMFPTGAILTNLVTGKARELLGFSSVDEVLSWVLWYLCANGLAEWDKEHKVYQMKKEALLTTYKTVHAVALMGSAFRRAIIVVHDSQTDRYHSSPEWEERFGFDEKDTGMMASFWGCLVRHNILVVEQGETIPSKVDHDVLRNLARACSYQEAWEAELREEGTQPLSAPVSTAQQYAGSSEAISRILKSIPECDRLVVCANAVALLQLPAKVI